MPRRAGGDAAGRETAEAVRKLRFRQSIRGLPQGSSLFLSAHQGNSEGMERSGMEEDLPGRFTGAQAKSPKPGPAGAAESCCAESMDEVESATAGRCLDTSFHLAGGISRRVSSVAASPTQRRRLTVQGVWCRKPAASSLRSTPLSPHALHQRCSAK